MHLALLEQLDLRCPTCRRLGLPPATLGLSAVLDRRGDELIEGILGCPQPGCQREHPVIDGVPIVVADLRAWAASQLDAVLRRDDLTPVTLSLLGDAAGAGTVLDNDRRNLSTYVDAHHRDRGVGSLPALLDAGLGLLRGPPSGTWVDVGCGPGGATFALAAAGAEIAVGADLSFSFLRAAERLRCDGRLHYGRRRLGVVFDQAEVSTELDDEARRRIGFLCADATELPLADGAAAGVVSLNVLDSTGDPTAHAIEVGRVVAPGGAALLATPYDWSSGATEIERWLGGHSQRGPDGGASEPAVRRLFGAEPVPGFDTGLVIGAEVARVPWHLRVHERGTMVYDVHLLRLDRVAGGV